jgi:hypothetical protein
MRSCPTWRRALTAAVVVALAPGHASAQVLHRTPAEGPATDLGVVARAGAPPTPSPLLDAGRAAAGDQAALALRGQASGARRSGSCAKRVVLFTLLGAGVGLAAAGVLLAATGGSDDTNAILTRWGLAGTAAGAAAGALTCLAP